MYYYIIDNQIIEFLEELDVNFYSYERLNEEQSNFYSSNPDASIEEILNLRLNEPNIPTFEDKKREKLVQLLSFFNEKRRNGYYDEALDITIAIDDYDRNQFIQKIGLLGLLPEESKPLETIIADINGVPRTISLVEFYTLMLNMGIYYETNVWGYKISKENAIKNASSEQELDEITL